MPPFATQHSYYANRQQPKQYPHQNMRQQLAGPYGSQRQPRMLKPLGTRGPNLGNPNAPQPFDPYHRPKARTSIPKMELGAGALGLSGMAIRAEMQKGQLYKQLGLLDTFKEPASFFAKPELAKEGLLTRHAKAKDVLEGLQRRGLAAGHKDFDAAQKTFSKVTSELQNLHKKLPTHAADLVSKNRFLGQVAETAGKTMEGKGVTSGFNAIRNAARKNIWKYGLGAAGLYGLSQLF